MIRHVSSLIGILGIGWGLGLFYFGGLWFTLRKLPKSRTPLALFSWSYLLRLGAILGIFHLILQRTESDQVLPFLLICFFGFLSSRTLLISAVIPRDPST